MKTTGIATQTYYRTGKGSHRHLDWYCANSKRSIQTGDVLTIPAADVDSWAPCADCTPVAEQARFAAAELVTEKPARCANTGVANPRRYQSTCVDCGKLGTVNRSTGTLRAHAPA